MSFIPSVLYTGDNSPQILDVFSRLLRDRAVILARPIDDDLANLIIAQLFHLEAENSSNEITMYINSPGGSVTSALAIYDIMQYIKPRVITICFGQACSAASLLLCAGERRHMTPNARLLLHQPSGSCSGQASDMRIQVKEIDEMDTIIKGIYHKHTGISLKKLDLLLDRDTIVRAEEAKKLGLIDDIVESRKEIKTELIIKMKVGDKKNAT